MDDTLTIDMIKRAKSVATRPQDGYYRIIQYTKPKMKRIREARRAGFHDLADQLLAIRKRWTRRDTIRGQIALAQHRQEIDAMWGSPPGGSMKD